MVTVRYYRSALILSVVLIVFSCATPRAPTGGPPDRTPPEIVRVYPANETVNFDGREVEFEFSKFMDRASILQALTVEPDLGIGFEVDWRRMTATVEFNTELPENTTVIIRLGTELQDTRSNRLASQYSLALSTGPVIDEGVVRGRLRLSRDGSGESGMRVFLYREPITLDERANFVAQTDTSGSFSFPYLSDGRYLAIWVDDQNRNRIWESDREWAQPFHEEEFFLETFVDSFAVKELGTIYIERPDTTAPRLQGAGLLAENRLRLRFNENIYWQEGARIAVLDTVGNHYTDAYPLYIPPGEPSILFAQTELPMSPESRYRLDLTGVTDSTGNKAEFSIDPFQGSAQPDTVSLRIIGDNSLPGIYLDEPLIVGYSKFIDDDNVLDSLKVVEGDVLNEEWESATVERHRLYVNPDSLWGEGYSYQILAWNPPNEQLRPIEPTIWRENQLGTFEITAPDTVGGYLNYVHIHDRDGKTSIDTSFTDRIEIDRLPPLNYTIQVFRDLNGNGVWDSGSVIPFEAPEPYFVRQGVPVRERATSQVLVEFN